MWGHEDTLTELRAIHDILAAIHKTQALHIKLTEKLMADLNADVAALSADFTALQTAVTGAVTDIGSLADQITALKQQLASAGTVDPAVLATLESLDTQARNMTVNLQNAVTPPAPASAAAPTPAPAAAPSETPTPEAAAASTAAPTA